MAECAFPLFPHQPSRVWHRYRQQDIAELAKQNALPILPVYTLIEQGPDIPLDAEDQHAGAMLCGALAMLNRERYFPVLPPLRHVPAQKPGQVFTLTAEAAWSLLEELLRSVAESGFRRLLVFHANPLLSDWLDCGLRDARIATGLTLYRMLIPDNAEALTQLLREVYTDLSEESSL
jgi:creatinine amidohydrolase